MRSQAESDAAPGPISRKLSSARFFIPYRLVALVVLIFAVAIARYPNFKFLGDHHPDSTHATMAGVTSAVEQGTTAGRWYQHIIKIQACFLSLCATCQCGLLRS